ncbi:MAG: hydrogenase maturation protease [Bacteroidota bacterium]
MTTQNATNDRCSETLIIGIGNKYRSDDSIGLLVARKLHDLHLPGVLIIEENGDGTILLQLWKKYSSVILIDAVRSGADAGKIHRMDLRDQMLPKEYFRFSTHHFSLADAVQLSRIMSDLPEHIIFYGIEGNNFNAGTGLSPEVSEALQKLVTAISYDVNS